MDVVIGLIVFALGAVAGFFANHFLSDASREKQKYAEKAYKSEAALAKYKQDVAEHLESSAKLLEQMNETCQVAMKQMSQSTQLLKQATPKDAASMPFFSEETQEQLAKTVALRHDRSKKDEEQVTQAPLDYSGEASGLFNDKSQVVTNSEN
ncbi:Z-ring associated ZapG family protein [Thalassotalea agarivorans]|uniref:Z-ring associated protein G n=1 Tax=Thalassotalea agarivorans TaxID=349064 RepID=A0A1I0FRX5_THASX|nr:DUF1043 family protein [Thalassotalea agarivorans]SET60952.1 hypothetical protein SAMN05660429_02196 [Thalassotalea agarivorans]